MIRIGMLSNCEDRNDMQQQEENGNYELANGFDEHAAKVVYASKSGRGKPSPKERGMLRIILCGGIPTAERMYTANEKWVGNMEKKERRLKQKSEEQIAQAKQERLEGIAAGIYSKNKANKSKRTQPARETTLQRNKSLNPRSQKSLVPYAETAEAR